MNPSSLPSTTPLARESWPAPVAARAGWPWTETTGADAYAPPPPDGWPKITVVCPSFQQGGFIEETIRSVLLQNYPALEFIVIDGGSTDTTVEILQRYATGLTHWESEPDRGQSHALNKGFDHATGDVLGWLNSDDYYLPGALAAVGRAFRSDPRALLYGDWAVRQDNQPELTWHRERPAFAFQVAVGGRHLPSHATFWPRQAHLRINETLRFTMDAELFKRLAASGLGARHVPQPLAVFRVHAASKTSRILDVAHAESTAWSRAQPWHTHWRWRFSNLIERYRRRFSR